MDLYGYRQIEVDIGGVNDVVPPVVLSAGDHDGRVLLVRLWDGAAAASPTGLTARLLYNSDPAKGSGGYVTMSAVSGEPTAAWRVAVPSEALAPGRSVLSVEISEGETIVASRRITAYVEPSVIDDGAPEAVDALAEFRAAIARLEDFTLPVTVEHGGTGATTVAAARNVLGLGNTSGALPVANGGTGQTTVAAARNALGLGNTSGALPVANGGTGSTSAADARTALGAVAKAGDTMTGALAINGLEASSTAFSIKTTATDGTAAAVEGPYLGFTDAANTLFGRVGAWWRTGGLEGLRMLMIRRVSGVAKYHGFSLDVDGSGNPVLTLTGNDTPGAWKKALGLDTITTSIMDGNDRTIFEPASGITFSEIKARKFGPCVMLRIVFKSPDNPIPASTTSDFTVGTFASAWRPGWETVVNLRQFAGSTYLDGAGALITGGGNLNLRTGVAIPKNTNIAVTGTWILPS